MQVEVADRVVPHSAEAEQSVLGAVLIDNAGWAKVAVLLQPTDFFRQAHGWIWEALGRVLGAGSVADYLTVCESLRAAGRLDECGGPAYVAALTDGVPRSGNVEHYARIVRDKATLRAAIFAGNRILANAYDAAMPPEFVLEAGVRDLLALSKPDGDGAVPIGDAAMAYVASLDSEDSDGCLPTGLLDLDALLRGGLRRKRMVMLAGRPGMGKAQPMSSLVLTASGFKKMGSVRIGEPLASPDGRPSLITGIFPQGNKPVFTVGFTDGRSATATADHLWRVNHRGWPRPRVLTTADIGRLLTKKRYRRRMWIDLPTNSEWSARSRQLPVDPWLLGVLIGDGNLSSGGVGFSSADDDIIERVATLVWPDLTVKHIANYDYRIVRFDGAHRRGVYGVRLNPLKEHMRQLGLLGKRSYEKMIPTAYMTASRAAREQLLAGLIDTDGRVEPWGTVSFCTTSYMLAEQVRELVRSIGGTCSLARRMKGYRAKDGALKIVRPSYAIGISHPHPERFVWLPRKRERLSAKKGHAQRRVHFSDIQPAGEADTQCISVSHPDGLYITNDHVVTHNTTLAMNIAETVAAGGVPTAVFSLEMDARALVEMALSRTARIDMQRLQARALSEPDQVRLGAALGKLCGTPLYIVEEAVTLVQVQAWSRRLRDEHDVGLFVLDYIQLIGDPSSRDRRAEIDQLSRGLKRTAKELDAVFIVLSQLTRASEARPDKRPQMSDLKESGALEADADYVVLIHRPEVYAKSTEADEGVAELIVAKNKGGATGVARVAYIKEQSHFANLAMT